MTQFRIAKLTAVGVGPGDPELITVKGMRRLEAADLIFVPRSRDGTISLAERIVQTMITPEQTVIRLPLPMTRNSDQLIEAWRDAADIIAAQFEQTGVTNGVYLLLGDPLLYGTFTYIWAQLAERYPDIEIEIVPGVTSFAATAAVTQTVLSTTNDRVAILPASYETDAAVLRQLLTQFDTIILMKAGTVLPQLIDALRELDLLDKAVYGERVGMPEEIIMHDVAMLSGERRPYLSLLIVRK